MTLRRMCLCRGECREHVGACRENGAPTRCDSCRRAKVRERSRTRDPFARRIYDTRTWRTLADAVVAAAEACHWCGTSAAFAKLTADHVESIRTRPDLALDPSNIVAACVGCQNKRRARPDVAQWQAWERAPKNTKKEASA